MGLGGAAGAVALVFVSRWVKKKSAGLLVFYEGGITFDYLGNSERYPWSSIKSVAYMPPGPAPSGMFIMTIDGRKHPLSLLGATEGEAALRELAEVAKPRAGAA